PILVGTDGKQKMSKSFNNAVGILDPADDLFGKTMSISDETMIQWRDLLALHYGLTGAAPVHPMEAKKELAEAIVARFHGKQIGKKARENFDAKFSKRDLEGADMPLMQVSENPIWIVKLLQEIGAASSGGEARRLINQGAVKLGSEKISDPSAQINIEGTPILQSGKKFFARLEAPK
ncbi:MAG: S4 domain-containing protein, partial [bacterium]